MNIKFFCALILIGSLLTGCSNYSYNPGAFKKDGPIFVKDIVPEPEPEPIPEPIPEPEPVMSVSEQNSQAMEALNALGFNTQESPQGVVVYFPPNIYFASNGGADINLDARTKIAEVSSEINKDYLIDREIEVSGHTDTLGDEQLNMATSKLRAEAAAAELVFSNVALTRIKTTWFGETRPRVEEYTADGKPIRENRALNRRVEFTILNPGY